MRTKIGLPFGLALVMFLGVFTTMLALGALNPRQAEAVVAEDPAPTLTLSTYTAREFPDVTVTFENDETVIEDGATILLTFAPSTALDTGDGVNHAENEANWLITGTDSADDPVAPADAADSTGEISLQLPSGVGIAEGAMVTIKYTQPTRTGAVDDTGALQNTAEGGDVTVSVAAPQGTTAQTSSARTILTQLDPDLFTIVNSPTDPGAVAQYRFTFTAGVTLNAGEDSITLHFDKDIKHDVSLSESNVTISATHTDDSRPAVNPSAVSRRVIQAATNNENIEYTLTIPDMDPGEDGVQAITETSVVTVTILTGAGFRNPTEAGESDKVGIYTSEEVTLLTKNFDVPLVLTLSDYTGNRNKAVTVTGKGFKGGTSADVWLDSNGDGVKDTGETVLINSVPVNSDDDTFTAQFSVLVPPFGRQGGDINYINAIDGEGNSMGRNQGSDETAPMFKIDGLMTVSPNAVGIGDTVTIELFDWPSGGENPELTIGGTRVYNAREIGTGADADFDKLDIGGGDEFEVDIPTGLTLGRQQIKYKDSKEDDTQNITITGADVTITPSSGVVPNQTVTIVGHGFTGGAEIDTFKFGSEDIESKYISGGEDVTADSGGNWAASVVIPISDTSTEANPAHQIRITDDEDRGGIGTVSVPERTLIIDPIVSRPGTTVTVTGTGFPARNTAGVSAPSVEITYDGDEVTRATTDSSGTFTVTFRVPSDTTIPSGNNVVKAEFNMNSVKGSATAFHSVPEGTITLSSNEAMAGETLTVTGEGFKAYRTLSEVTIGTVEVTPSPKPSTGVDGTFAATILVPALELGSHTVKVDVAGTVASAILTIVETPTSTTMMMEAEAATPDVAFAAVIAEDNLIAVYHFDPATQNEAPNYGYTVYDARPLFMSGNNLDSIEPGQFYTVQVSEDQMGVTLGSQTVDLYAPFTPIRW